jgi:hypothetical protein
MWLRGGSSKHVVDFAKTPVLPIPYVPFCVHVGCHQVVVRICGTTPIHSCKAGMYSFQNLSDVMACLAVVMQRTSSGRRVFWPWIHAGCFLKCCVVVILCRVSHFSKRWSLLMLPQRLPITMYLPNCLFHRSVHIRLHFGGPNFGR